MQDFLRDSQGKCDECVHETTAWGWELPDLGFVS